jgi:hypothetical protein
MTDLKRMRLLCGLRQIDVWANTGVPLYRISLAERGAVQLSESEEKLIRMFLREKWATLQVAEGQTNLVVSSPPARQVARGG